MEVQVSPLTRTPYFAGVISGHITSYPSDTRGRFGIFYSYVSMRAHSCVQVLSLSFRVNLIAYMKFEYMIYYRDLLLLPIAWLLSLTPQGSQPVNPKNPNIFIPRLSKVQGSTWVQRMCIEWYCKG